MQCWNYCVRNQVSSLVIKSNFSFGKQVELDFHFIIQNVYFELIEAQSFLRGHQSFHSFEFGT